MLQVLVDISLKSFVVAKRHGAMQKFEKKKKKKEKKWTQRCLEYLKQWVLRCPPKKSKKKR